MTDHHAPDPNEKKRWLDDPKNIDKIWYALIGVSVLLFAMDFAYKKHPYFGIEKLPNFYGLYGFIGCVFLVLAAAQLRKILMRVENFYEKKDARHETDNFGDSASDPDAADTPITGHVHHEAEKGGHA